MAGERVFEAAGRNRQNFQVVHGIIGMAKLTISSNGITVANAIGGIAYSGATSDIVGSNGIQMSFAARFGTIAPNVLIQCGNVNSTLFAVANVINVASNSLAFMVSQIPVSSASSNIQVLGGTGINATIFFLGYSQTGTAFT